jgi:hypothetical protein
MVQLPPPVGKPIERYATPRGTLLPENRSPGANAPVVSRLTSPESDMSPKRLPAALAVESIARHSADPGRTSTSSPSFESVNGSIADESFKMLRLMWRRRHAVSVCG